MNPAHCLDAAGFAAALADPTPLLVDFSSDWCPPCRALEPLLEEARARYSGRVRVLQVDASQHRSLAARYNIRGLPTLVGFVSGEPVERQVGLPSRGRLTELLEALIG